MEIRGRQIGSNYEPYVIAEISGNHNGDLQKAGDCIRAAHEAGADAIKIQTYTPDSLTLNSDKDDFLIKKGLWAGKKLYDLYDWAHTPYEWHEELFKIAKDLGAVIFSSPFDEGAADLLGKLNAPAFKIASFELNDHQLIRHVAKKGQPIILSTGMSKMEEIKAAVDVALSEDTKDIAVLHCISSYPAMSEEANLKFIQTLQNAFPAIAIGLSDHTMGHHVACAAVALGANVIEKHFTLDRADKGPDSEFSMEPNEFRDLVKNVKNIWHGLGDGSDVRARSEAENKIFRRSLYFTKTLKPGDLITQDSVRSVRPGFGLPPYMLEEILGKEIKVGVEFGDPVIFDVIVNEIL